MSIRLLIVVLALGLSLPTAFSGCGAGTKKDETKSGADGGGDKDQGSPDKTDSNTTMPD